MVWGGRPSARPPYQRGQVAPRGRLGDPLSEVSLRDSRVSPKISLQGKAAMRSKPHVRFGERDERDRSGVIPVWRSRLYSTEISIRLDPFAPQRLTAAVSAGTISSTFFVHLLSQPLHGESVNNPGDQLILQRFSAYHVMVFPTQVVLPPPTC